MKEIDGEVMCELREDRLCGRLVAGGGFEGVQDRTRSS